MKTRSIFQDAIIANETERRIERLSDARNNTAWAYRTQPPEGWSGPLPEKLKVDQLPFSDPADFYKSGQCVIL